MEALFLEWMGTAPVVTVVAVYLVWDFRDKKEIREGLARAHRRIDNVQKG
jgi:hypothetical protein